MATSSEAKTRQTVRYLQQQCDSGGKQPFEDLVRAWRGIKILPPTDKRLFFVLGDYHGEPFQYRRQVNALSTVDAYTYCGKF